MEVTATVEQTLEQVHKAFYIGTGKVEEVIEKKGGAYLEDYALFDLYEGAQIKEGFKSVVILDRIPREG